jgi:hypothetical protein
MKSGNCGVSPNASCDHDSPNVSATHDSTARIKIMCGGVRGKVESRQRFTSRGLSHCNIFQKIFRFPMIYALQQIDDRVYHYHRNANDTRNAKDG